MSVQNTTPDIERADGSRWVSSYRDAGSAVVALFDSRAPQFYFRRVAENPARRWWCPWRPRYVLDGAVWEGSDMRGAGFRVSEKGAE